MSETSVAQGKRREREERLARERRGIALFRERGEEIEHLKGRRWAVPSCSAGNPGLYVVDLEAETCECPDFEKRGDSFACKHIYAAAIARARSGECAECARKVPYRELHPVPEDHLTFFEGDELCEGCAMDHGVL